MPRLNRFIGRQTPALSFLPTATRQSHTPLYLIGPARSERSTLRRRIYRSDAQRCVVNGTKKGPLQRSMAISARQQWQFESCPPPTSESVDMHNCCWAVIAPSGCKIVDLASSASAPHPHGPPA